eukprot:gb/GEZN01008966.1/.p1 GENE.gb/GEZN01008966.1/~~gb/GEZN01008966.1/.p1  ORF type:complete len:430 (-),score=23.82 gb/GEZN01008966.1/:1-1290(-)
MTTSLQWANLEMKFCIVLLGSERLFISSRIQRYFQWLGIYTQVFGEFQSRLVREDGKTQTWTALANISSNKKEGEENVDKTLRGDPTTEAILLWLKTPKSHIALLDARGATQERCRDLTSFFTREGVRVVFIESICTDLEVLEGTLALHQGMVDFIPDEKNAILKDESLPFLQVYNLGRKMIANRCSGFYFSRITTILSHMHVRPRHIWISRHGESQDNTIGRLGGDSSLSGLGREYAKKLASFILRNEKSSDLVVLTSSLQRTLQTAEALFQRKPAYRNNHVCTPRLNEIGTGICDGMTYAQVKQKYPELYQARKKNKYSFRYPMGESYADVIERVSPVMLELERHTSNVLLICHQALLRTVLAYFLEIPHAQMVNYPVPLHCVLKLTPGPRNVNIERFQLAVVPEELMSMHGDYSEETGSHHASSKL